MYFELKYLKGWYNFIINLDMNRIIINLLRYMIIIQKRWWSSIIPKYKIVNTRTNLLTTKSMINKILSILFHSHSNNSINSIILWNYFLISDKYFIIDIYTTFLYRYVIVWLVCFQCCGYYLIILSIHLCCNLFNFFIGFNFDLSCKTMGFKIVARL